MAFTSIVYFSQDIIAVSIRSENVQPSNFRYRRHDFYERFARYSVLKIIFQMGSVLVRLLAYFSRVINAQASKSDRKCKYISLDI